MMKGENAIPSALLPKPTRLVETDVIWPVPEKVLVHGPGADLAVDLLAHRLGWTRSADGEADVRFTVGVEGIAPEGYRLKVTEDGILVDASDAAGALNAALTILQLVPPTGPRELPGVEIEDAPRFRWRGLHLDCVRHFFPVEFVHRLLDLMAMHKLNVFHWHLTDDQGWRFPSARYPRLTEVGAWRAQTVEIAEDAAPGTFDGTRHGGFYSPDDIRAVIAHATALGITVLPEIEMPGHATAALAAYPHLGCTGEALDVACDFGVLPNAFCAGNDDVFEFLTGVLDEVIELFPSKFIHVGGDECVKTQWAACPKCQQRMRDEGLRDENELQSWFVGRIAKHLSARGRTLIGWDEILEGGLARDVAVMNWRGLEHGVNAVKAGAEIVMSPTSHCYLDYYQSDDPKEPRAIFTRETHITLEQAYAFDPVPPGLTPEEERLVLGGQANVWTEFMPDTAHVEYMIFPRLCALAEVFWSDPVGRSFEEFSSRLRGHLHRLDQLNVNYRLP